MPITDFYENLKLALINRPCHANVRWLSLGKMLKRLWDLKSEIPLICKNSAKYVDFPPLQDGQVDMMALMNEQNSKQNSKL